MDCENKIMCVDCNKLYRKYELKRHSRSKKHILKSGIQPNQIKIVARKLFSDRICGYMIDKSKYDKIWSNNFINRLIRDNVDNKINIKCTETSDGYYKYTIKKGTYKTKQCKDINNNIMILITEEECSDAEE